MNKLRFGVKLCKSLILLLRLVHSGFQLVRTSRRFVLRNNGGTVFFLLRLRQNSLSFAFQIVINSLRQLVISLNLPADKLNGVGVKPVYFLNKRLNFLVTSDNSAASVHKLVKPLFVMVKQSEFFRPCVRRFIGSIGSAFKGVRSLFNLGKLLGIFRTCPFRYFRRAFLHTVEYGHTCHKCGNCRSRQYVRICGNNSIKQRLSRSSSHHNALVSNKSRDRRPDNRHQRVSLVNDRPENICQKRENGVPQKVNRRRCQP